MKELFEFVGFFAICGIIFVGFFSFLIVCTNIVLPTTTYDWECKEFVKVKDNLNKMECINWVAKERKQ